MDKNELITYVYSKMSESDNANIAIATKNASIIYSIYEDRLLQEDLETKTMLDFILNKLLNNS